MIAAIGNRLPMMVKAHVSPGLRAKTKPQIEQRSSWDHLEKSRPSPQCGQRLRSPRRSAVLINFEREDVIHKRIRLWVKRAAGHQEPDRSRGHDERGSSQRTEHTAEVKLLAPVAWPWGSKVRLSIRQR
jgi:hypothetical protein